MKRIIKVGIGAMVIASFFYGLAPALAMLGLLGWISAMVIAFKLINVSHYSYLKTKTWRPLYIHASAKTFLGIYFLATMILLATLSDISGSGAQYWFQADGVIFGTLIVITVSSLFLGLFLTGSSARSFIKKETMLDRITKNQRVLRGSARGNADDIADQLRDMD